MSNFFLVGLLFPVLASEFFRLSRYLVVLQHAERSAPILLGMLQALYLRAQFRELFFQRFHAFFKRLRHSANNIGDWFPAIDKILESGPRPKPTCMYANQSAATSDWMSTAGKEALLESQLVGDVALKANGAIDGAAN